MFKRIIIWTSSVLMAAALVLLGFVVVEFLNSEGKRAALETSFSVRLDAVETRLVSLQNALTSAQTDSSELKTRVDGGLLTLQDIYFESLKKNDGLQPIWADSRPGRRAYLTFDDGPSENTSIVLDALKKEKVRADFFVNGRPQFSDLYQRIQSEGHIIGNHTYTHDYNQIYSSIGAFLQDVDRLDAFLATLSIKPPKIYRFPGGAKNEFAVRLGGPDLTGRITVAMADRGYKFYEWNVEYGVAEGGPFGSSEEIRKHIVDSARRKRVAVILLHDGPGHRSTALAVEGIIEDLRKLGFKLEQLPLVPFPLDRCWFPFYFGDMTVLGMSALQALFQEYFNTELTYSPEVAAALGLVASESQLKLQGAQFPCAVHSSSFQSAKILVRLKPQQWKELEFGSKLATLSLILLSPRGGKKELFQFNGSLQILQEHVAPEGDLILLTVLTFSHRPHETFLQTQGSFLNLKKEAHQRQADRILLNAESQALLGLTSLNTSVLIEKIERKCLLRELSYGGARVILTGLGQFLMEKPFELVLPYDTGNVVLPGKIMRAEAVEGHRGLAVIALNYHEDQVPLQYLNSLQKGLKLGLGSKKAEKVSVVKTNGPQTSVIDMNTLKLRKR